MNEGLRCYRCGESLAALTPPISRSDECPSCTNSLHVCRMCRSFDVSVPAQCREDDAEEVFEKERPNFCDWFVPSAKAFDPEGIRQENDAKDTLAALFGEETATDTRTDSETKAAEDLFR